MVPRAPGPRWASLSSLRTTGADPEARKETNTPNWGGPPRENNLEFLGIASQSKL
jgi:hypothetical protein